MPAATYMIVDPRRDHSLRVPRPDLSVTLGTPNACNGCHANRDARWAAARVEAWFGHNPQGYQRFGPAFSLGHADTRDRQADLRAVANDATQPAIARATALAELDASSNPAAIDTLAHGLQNPSGIVRLGALQSLRGAPLDVLTSRPYGLPRPPSSKRHDYRSVIDGCATRRFFEWTIDRCLAT